MAIPDYETLMLPVLEIAGDGQEHRISEVVDQLARAFRLTEEERRQLLPSGKQTAALKPFFKSVLGDFLSRPRLRRGTGSFFPWAKMSIDEEFYAEYDYDRYREECGHYDREDDVYFYHETFGEWKAAHDLSALRPYLDDGEVANWRLTLELNELGKSFLSIHNCRQFCFPGLS
ncbi:MAG: restriction system protein [Acidobacteriaceae bacterium]|jgi:hypothetical protein|nr:restriction system protein [Acidobacteriaceae bacterium]